MQGAPLIETERLILRGFQRDDLDALAAILGNPEVTKHLTGTPMSREDSFRRMMMAVGQWPLLGFGYWAVELKPVGQLVGQVGFADFKQCGLILDRHAFAGATWIADERRMLLHRGGEHHVHQFILILRSHGDDVRHAAEIGDIEQAVVRGAVVGGKARAVHAEDYGQILERDVMHDAIVGALEER